MKKRLLLTIILVLVGSVAADRPTSEQIAERRANSVVAQISDTLTPGTWGTIPIIPFTTHTYVYDGVSYELSLLKSPPPSTGFDILGWCDDSHWDSVTGQYFHIGLRKTRKFICYSEATNAWRVIDLPLNHDSAQSPHIAAYWGHVYGNNAFDIENSRFYHHAHSSNALPEGIDSGANYPARICYFDAITETWTKLGSCPSMNKETSIEYFSAMKGLVCISQGSGGGKLDFYSDSTKTWRVLANGMYLGGYHTLGRHNPFREEVLFVGGNAQPQGVMRLKKDGTLERLNDLPIPIGMSSDKITVDPISGRYLIRISLDNGVFRFFEFDSDNNEYKEIAHPPLAKQGGIWGVYDMPTCAFIPEYKVTMWTYGNKVHVYKHDTLKAVAIEKKTATLASGKLSFTASPNPSKGLLSIQINGALQNGRLVIHDINGKVLETVEMGSKERITVGYNYPNGVYFAKMHYSSGSSSAIRFMIAR